MAVTTRAASWRYLSDADCAHVLVRLVREVAQVAQAKGIAFVDDVASIPLRILIQASERDAVEAVLKVGENMRSRAPNHRMSALQDLEAGRPLESEETFGYARRLANELGLALPLLDAFYHLVTGIDHARGDHPHGLSA
jgi:2-dehydropantoate 2-reductase